MQGGPLCVGNDNKGTISYDSGMEGLISIEYTDEELSNCCKPTKRALFSREWSPSFLLTNGSLSSSIIIITAIRKCVNRLPLGTMLRMYLL